MIKDVIIRWVQDSGRSSHLRATSPSAVSEAPPSEELGVRRCVGALQIQRLEGSRPGGLWDLYLDEPVVDRLRDGACCRCAWVSVAGGRENGRGAARRRVWSRTTVLHSDECETENQCARRSTSEIRGWRCGFMRRTG